MCSSSDRRPLTANPPAPEIITPNDFLSVIRSRLNVIGASMYLLENSLDRKDCSRLRYVEKIKEELEVIRRLING